MSDPAEGATRVAFGDFPVWESMIRPNVASRYDASFVDLSDVDLDAFDAVIPLKITHYAPLMRRPDLLGRKYFHPAPEVVRLCDDKLELARFLTARGFADHVPALRRPGAPYPYVRKRRRGWWGLHCQIVACAEDERALDLADADWFTQAFVPGDVEFATHVLRTDGQVRYASTFAYKMASDVFVKGASDTPLQTRFHPGSFFLDLFSELLAVLDFQGTACIDYKVVDLRPVLFEINPRFGGSLSLDISAYLDAYVGALSAGSATPPAAAV